MNPPCFGVSKTKTQKSLFPPAQASRRLDSSSFRPQFTIKPAFPNQRFELEVGKVCAKGTLPTCCCYQIPCINDAFVQLLLLLLHILGATTGPEQGGWGSKWIIRNSTSPIKFLCQCTVQAEIRTYLLMYSAALAIPSYLKEKYFVFSY